jgi:hypothetical protein
MLGVCCRLSLNYPQDGPIQLDLITDNSSDLVLHWGVCKPGWLVPL